jgi:hypothetical protein
LYNNINGPLSLVEIQNHSGKLFSLKLFETFDKFHPHSRCASSTPKRNRTCFEAAENQNAKL